MKNKGQVTLFIIVGIILLVIAILTFYLFSITGEKTVPEGEVDTRAIEFMIDNCISKVGREGLDLLGKNGNYIEIPNILKINKTSYWIYKYANVMPVLNSSIDEFQVWFNNKFESCVDFTPFVGYNVEEGQPNSSIEYTAEEVVFKLNYPIKISQGSKQKTLENFQQTLNIRYRRIYERAREIINIHFFALFDYRKALQFVDKRDFKITYNWSDENNLLFTIKDENELEQSNEYVFNFATNLNRTHLKRVVELNPRSLDFFMPYIVYSPDRMAQLFLQRGVRPNNDRLFVWQNYTSNVSREVISQVEYTIKGGIKPGQKIKENITWNLNYPVYHFGPDGTKFYDKNGEDFPQRLAIYWDDEKNPNLGPMGILYRGALSDYEWRPLITGVDYNNSFVYADILGFSEYSPLDCNRQACKSVSTKSKSKPKQSLLCAIGQLLHNLLPILIVLVIIILILSMGSAGGLIVAFFKVFTASATASSLAHGITFVFLSNSIAVGAIYLGATTLVIGAISVGLTAFGAEDFSGGETYVSFVPTCDQIIEVSCIGSSHLDSGYGELNGERIPADSTKEFTINGGETQQLVAVAEECENGFASCHSCSITCTAYYK